MKIVVSLTKTELSDLGVNKDALKSFIWEQIAAAPVSPNANVELKNVQYYVDVILKN